MNKAGPWWLILLAMGLVLAACAPAAAPTALPAPPAAPSPAPAAPALAPQEAAWAKVVEAAKKEGRLTIYSFNFTGELGVMLARAFEERYGIRVDIITGRGAEFLERVKTEKRVGQQTADMTDGSAIHVKNMKLEGLTSSVADELPALREKGVWLIDPVGLDPKDKHQIHHFISTYAAYINTKLVKPGEEPRVWRDLLQPRWKGKMTLTDYKVSGGPYLLFTPLLREKVVDEDFIKALGKQELRFYTSVVDETRTLSRGDQYLMIRGSDSSSARFVIEGAPIKPAELEDGTTLSPGAQAAFVGAPHPNAAKLFMNWIMTAEGQTVHGKYKATNSVRRDVPDFRPPSMQFTPKRPVLISLEDNEEGTRLFRENWLGKLWGEKR